MSGFISGHDFMQNYTAHNGGERRKWVKREKSALKQNFAYYTNTPTISIFPD